MIKVLVVDDHREVRDSFALLLKRNGIPYLVASNGKTALEIFEKEKPLVVLLDLVMPVMDGITTLAEMKKRNPAVPVIVMTAYAEIEVAVKAMKLGAYDFIVKPPDFTRLVALVKEAIQQARPHRARESGHNDIESFLKMELGKSEIMEDVIAQIRIVASCDFSVILQGETGVGKNFIANMIHDLGKRRDKPFITVDLGAIPETLVESELFGYEKGAFTGAEQKKKGLLEMANGGTLFIDELQNVLPFVQSKLLRMVEEKKIYPIGSPLPVEIDMRIISATNADIYGAVEENKFREDLYFRLSEFLITIPPLRERREDIPFFTEKLLRGAAEELKKTIREISDEVSDLLMRYTWKGNIRELKNVIKRAVLLCNDGVIKPEHISFLAKDSAKQKDEFVMLMPLKELLDSSSKKAVEQAMIIARGNKLKAASLLQIDYKTLLKKVKEYNITP